MMKFALLLILLWSLVEVLSQTAPYLTFMGGTLPNHSYVDLSRYTLGEFGDTDDEHVVCHTDLTSCCGGGGHPDRGYWFFPNGTRLLQVYNGDPDAAATVPIAMRRRPFTQTVSLIRGTGPGVIPSGIYRCDIETNAVNNPGNESIFVGVYSTGGMCSIHN